jgi:hypothetical protein
VTADIETVAQQLTQHLREGTTDMGDELRVPVTHFTTPEHAALERKVLMRMPLIIGRGSEIPRKGDFITREVLGIPLILVRKADGRVASYVNICRHRGGRVENEDGGNKRFFLHLRLPRLELGLLEIRFLVRPEIRARGMGGPREGCPARGPVSGKRVDFQLTTSGDHELAIDMADAVSTPPEVPHWRDSRMDPLWTRFEAQKRAKRSSRCHRRAKQAGAHRCRSGPVSAPASTPAQAAASTPKIAPRGHGVAGSNPVSPTTKQALTRRFSPSRQDPTARRAGRNFCTQSALH